MAVSIESLRIAANAYRKSIAQMRAFRLFHEQFSRRELDAEPVHRLDFYQSIRVTALVNKRRILVADGTGTGKTPTAVGGAIALLEEKRNTDPNKTLRVLVVSPNIGVEATWTRENINGYASWVGWGKGDKELTVSNVERKTTKKDGKRKSEIVGLEGNGTIHFTVLNIEKFKGEHDHFKPRVILKTVLEPLKRQKLITKEELEELYGILTEAKEKYMDDELDECKELVERFHRRFGEIMERHKESKKKEHKDYTELMADAVQYKLLAVLDEAKRKENEYLRPLLDQDFDLIVLDESHNFANLKSNSTQNVRLILDKHRDKHLLLLTATPIANHVHDIGFILNALQPDIFPDPEGYHYDQNPDALRQLVESQQVFRIKLRELGIPEPEETEEKVELTDAEADLQFNMWRRALGIYKLTKMRIGLINPELLDPNYKGERSKFKKAKEIVDAALKNGRKVVIYSYYVHEILPELQKYLKVKLIIEELMPFLKKADLNRQDALEKIEAYLDALLRLEDLRAYLKAQRMKPGDIEGLLEFWKEGTEFSKVTDILKSAKLKDKVIAEIGICWKKGGKAITDFDKYTTHRRDANEIKTQLVRALKEKEDEILRIDSDTPTRPTKNGVPTRAKIAETFRTSEKARVAIISSVAGESISLAPGETPVTLINLEPPISIPKWEQTIGRVYRREQRANGNGNGASHIKVHTLVSHSKRLTELMRNYVEDLAVEGIEAEKFEARCIDWGLFQLLRYKRGLVEKMFDGDLTSKEDQEIYDLTEKGAEAFLQASVFSSFLRMPAFQVVILIDNILRNGGSAFIKDWMSKKEQGLKYAEKYEEGWEGSLSQHTLQLMRSILHRNYTPTLEREGSIVDIGGAAAYTSRVLRRNTTVVDLNEFAFGIGKKKSEDAGLDNKFIHADMLQTGLPDASAKIVTASYCLHHLKQNGNTRQVEEALLEFNRIMQKDGLLFITFPWSARLGERRDGELNMEAFKRSMAQYGFEALPESDVYRGIFEDDKKSRQILLIVARKKEDCNGRKDGLAKDFTVYSNEPKEKWTVDRQKTRMSNTGGKPRVKPRDIDGREPEEEKKKVKGFETEDGKSKIELA